MKKQYLGFASACGGVHAEVVFRKASEEIDVYSLTDLRLDLPSRKTHASILHMFVFRQGTTSKDFGLRTACHWEIARDRFLKLVLKTLISVI